MKTKSRMRVFPTSHLERRMTSTGFFCQNSMCPSVGKEFPLNKMLKVGEFYFHSPECAETFNKNFKIFKD